MMPNLEVNLRKLMEAGAHFGHQTFRWNPKMRPYIFTVRNGIHIIDLDQTMKALEAAYKVVVDVVAAGKEVMFVGTKRQAQDIVIEACTACEMPYVVFRWLGGMLTNFNTIQTSVRRLEKIEETLNNQQEAATFTKKELLHMQKQAAKLRRNLSGMAKMKRLPGALFVIDPKSERIAVLEAKRERIPVIAITDSNCDPDLVDFVIPGNDDAIKSIELFTNAIKNACLEGRQQFEERAREQATKEEETPDKSETTTEAAEKLPTEAVEKDETVAAATENG